MIWTRRGGAAGNRTGRPLLRWTTVIRCGIVVGLPIILVAGLSAADPWLSQFPREPGRRITELFLRAVLLGYLSVLLLIPVVLAGSIWLLIRAHRQRSSRFWPARIVLLCGSTALAVLGIELAAAAWLAWAHRMPVLPTEFPERSPDNELSLVVLGGSSAMGYPYSPWLSVGQIVGWQIEQALPARRVNVDILANLGRNLEDQHKALATLKRRPDVVIVDSGHNEFLSRFDGSRDAGYAEAPTGALLLWAYHFSLHSPLCLWIYETVRQHRLGGPPPSLNRHHLIDTPMFTPSEYLTIVDDFRLRLEAIADYCARIGAVAVLVIPPGNESGFEPNRSILSDRLSPQDREQLTERYRAARAVEPVAPEESMKMYRSLLSEQSDFAEIHFRLARLLEDAGAYDEARSHYVKARDLDGFPVRCRSEFAEIFREVARRHPCILIDGPDVLRARSRHGIINDELVHDAHHPTFEGHLALSQAIVRELHRQRALGLGRDGAQAPEISLAECARHFGVDSQVWTLACVRTGMYYMHLSATRFDPVEREAKQRRWEKAANDLRAGKIRPEEAGVPGIGVPAPVPSRMKWWLEVPSGAQAYLQP